MKTTKAFICVIALVLLAACGPRRLTSPPDEFTEFVDSAPIKSNVTLLGEWSYVSQVETTICTRFENVRLYGVNAPFSDVISHFEATLTEDGIHYIKIERIGHHVYLVSQFGLMSVYPVGNDDPVAEYQFGEEVLKAAHDTYNTVYSISAEHRYGNCEPHPRWSD